MQITFRRHGNGEVMPGVDAVKAGDVYVVMLRGESAPCQMFAAMRAVEAVVEPKFGAKPGDRLMAELAAMSRSNDAGLRIAPIEPAIRNTATWENLGGRGQTSVSHVLERTCGDS